MHVPPSVPDDPALQVQFVKTALPTGEFEFDGQAVHVELAEAPAAVEYVPAPQSVHVMADTVLYLPATHVVHAEFAEAVPSSLVAVKSTPRTMALAIALVAFVLRYSSTTNTPAMSPLKKASVQWLLPNQLKDDVLSVVFADAIAAELATPFTVSQHSLVDARYPTSTVSHEFCTITPDDDLVQTEDAPL